MKGTHRGPRCAARKLTNAQLRIVHRDLAARNVLLDSSGAPKIGDFGLSLYIAAPHQALNSDFGSKWYETLETLRGFLSLTVLGWHPNALWHSNILKNRMTVIVW